MREYRNAPDTAVQVRLKSPLLKLFEDYRRRLPGKIPPRSIVARELISRALDADRQRKPAA
jgi:hypothetical protein